MATGRSAMMLALHRAYVCSILAVGTRRCIGTSCRTRTCAFLVTCSCIRTVLACLCASRSLAAFCSALACIRAVLCIRTLASLGTISHIRTICRVRTYILCGLAVIVCGNSIHTLATMRTCHILVYRRLDVLRKGYKRHKRNGSQYY